MVRLLYAQCNQTRESLCCYIELTVRRIPGAAFRDNLAAGIFVQQLCDMAAERRATRPSVAALFVRKVPRPTCVASTASGCLSVVRLFL